MQPVEAITRLIAMADELTTITEGSREATVAEGDQLAVSVIQAMLNTALPVARFRAHVTVDTVGSKSKLGLGDFTVSATSIAAIKNGLVGLSMEALAVHVTLWEQRSTGADMLNGYQGQSRSLSYRNWLKQIDDFELAPTVQ